MGYRHYAAPERPAKSEHAISALLSLFAASPGEIGLVILGALANIVIALAQHPNPARQVGHCWVMGGAANTVGNMTSAARLVITPLRPVPCDSMVSAYGTQSLSFAPAQVVNHPMRHPCQC